MRLSEERISYLSRLILDTLWKEDLMDLEREEVVLQEIKRTMRDFLRVEDEVDEMVRRKIRSMSRIIPEGGREWEILYKKFFEEEMRKRGFGTP